jgi:hypothetical protein
MAFTAQNRPTYFWLKWHLITFPAMIANDVKSFGSVLAHSGPLRPALRAALRSHHIALIKNFLLFFCKKENFLALNASHF